MFEIFRALKNGFETMFHPKMIFAAFLPLIASVAAFVIFCIFIWSDVSSWLITSTSDWWILNQIGILLNDVGLNAGGFGEFFAWIITLICVIVLSLIIGLVIAGILVTPLAVNLISKNHYPYLTRDGKYATGISILNSIKVTVIFALGWLITLPLWLIPGLSIVLSLFWISYAYANMTKVDAIVEHATPEERKYVISNYKSGFWIIGFICALLSLIPLLGLIMPVYSIISCTHYGLALLDKIRKDGRELTTVPAR
ncbi:EI24 domain-containing protein [Taylorella asinigenitalis]|uniref:EI24 domain-containing protein n=1 Tax=Taylorella asinigenitalis TaxID=84590 RepID=UPI00048AD020|nr:EI24 domain-containing protein [Taylorella asinigenitalis]